MGVLVTLGWFFSFVQLLTFESITSKFGPHVSFLCFAGFNFVGGCLVLICLPETKGRTVEEIEMQLDKKSVMINAEVDAVTSDSKLNKF